MVDYENMVKALRLSWLKRIIDDSCSSHGGLFVFNCNYAANKLNISNFYYELLLWWSELRDLVDCDGEYRFIIWNKEIKVDGKSVFYKRYLSKGIKYTKDLLHDKTNIDSFNISEGEKSLNSNFLTLTGLRHVVPLNLRTHPHSFTLILGMENFKCRNYHSLLIKFKYEKPTKWAKMKE